MTGSGVWKVKRSVSAPTVNPLTSISLWKPFLTPLEASRAPCPLRSKVRRRQLSGSTAFRTTNRHLWTELRSCDAANVESDVLSSHVSLPRSPASSACLIVKSGRSGEVIAATGQQTSGWSPAAPSTAATLPQRCRQGCNLELVSKTFILCVTLGAL